MQTYSARSVCANDTLSGGKLLTNPPSLRGASPAATGAAGLGGAPAPTSWSWTVTASCTNGFVLSPPPDSRGPPAVADDDCIGPGASSTFIFKKNVFKNGRGVRDAETAPARVGTTAQTQARQVHAISGQKKHATCDTCVKVSSGSRIPPYGRARAHTAKEGCSSSALVPCGAPRLKRKNPTVLQSASTPLQGAAAGAALTVRQAQGSESDNHFVRVPPAVRAFVAGRPTGLFGGHMPPPSLCATAKKVKDTVSPCPNQAWQAAMQ